MNYGVPKKRERTEPALLPWKDEGFTTLRPVQTFTGVAMQPQLCEAICGASSKYLFATPDNRALALCPECAELAQKDGAIAADVLL